MATFCRKAVAQGGVIAVRFMGRYPPTARSVYKPPADSSRDHHHFASQIQLSGIRYGPHIASIVSIDHQGDAAAWHWLDDDPGDEGVLEALAEKIEGLCTDKLSLEQAMAIKAMVAQGKISLLVYVLLLIELFVLERL